ncbi:MAG: glycosyltransferase family 4 protein [Chitinophagales bacterium]|nr:glycosyltransferase family 4 protein [Chitinophagales bacterium]
MRILQLCKKFPYPMKDGEAIAIMNLTKAFSTHGVEVKLLCMNTAKHYFDLNELPSGIRKLADFGAVDIDTSINLMDALLSFFRKVPYVLERFVDKRYKAALIRTLSNEEFDIIQCEGIFLAPYLNVIKRHSNACVVLRSHNIEAEIWNRLSSNARFGAKKLFLTRMSKQMKDFEKEFINKFDAVVAISEIDEDKIRQLGFDKPLCTIQSGFDFNETMELSKRDGDGIFFIGGLDWIPNQEGIRWFIDNILPLVHKEIPSVLFHIAGRNMPDWFNDLSSPNIIIAGEVEDAYSFMNDRYVMIVPLLSGSGMRIKIVEALALKRLVVTTSIGAEGVRYVNGQHLLIADTIEEFAAAIISCIKDKQIANGIRENGYTFVRENLDNKKLGEKLLKFYSQLV